MTEPGWPVAEPQAVAVAVHQARGGPDEFLGGGEIDRHAPGRYARVGRTVFEKSDAYPRGCAADGSWCATRNWLAPSAVARVSGLSSACCDTRTRSFLTAPRGHQTPALRIGDLSVMDHVSVHAAPLVSSTPALRVSRLGVSYGAIEALADIDFEVARGEIVAVCGEPGAGKSTLVRCLVGDVAPDVGHATLDGLPLAPGSRTRARDRCGRRLAGGRALPQPRRRRQPPARPGDASADALELALPRRGRRDAARAADPDPRHHPPRRFAGRWQRQLLAMALAISRAAQPAHPRRADGGAWAPSRPRRSRS